MLGSMTCAMSYGTSGGDAARLDEGVSLLRRVRDDEAAGAAQRDLAARGIRLVQMACRLDAAAGG
ncbi:hypothetical protein ElP_27190 [Tautonia plasticadhaerens]|uniref:Uncharacterized protein n=2 Tax=Tautonia plasticadhaerens TaxID=2527974 RepID=A0A518H1V7_9BACT|nr:hypothetical protein ElP_27190 [Tautonia plasticadhaerens]